MLRRAFAVAFLLALAVSALAQGNPRGTAKVTLGGKVVEIEYGRPSLRGRDMLGQAQVGEDWRMGADAATTLKTEADLTFGAARVPKGDYVLTASKVTEGQWQLNVRRPDGTVVAEIPLESTTVKQPAEVFTIELAEEKGAGTFRMTWGDRALLARFASR